jgi:hypothetical protein
MRHLHKFRNYDHRLSKQRSRRPFVATKVVPGPPGLRNIDAPFASNKVPEKGKYMDPQIGDIHISQLRVSRLDCLRI